MKPQIGMKINNVWNHHLDKTEGGSLQVMRNPDIEFWTLQAKQVSFADQKPAGGLILRKQRIDEDSPHLQIWKNNL